MMHHVSSLSVMNSAAMVRLVELQALAMLTLLMRETHYCRYVQVLKTVHLFRYLKVLNTSLSGKSAMNLIK